MIWTWVVFPMAFGVGVLISGLAWNSLRVTRTLKKPSKKLSSFSDLSPHMRSTPYITDGYRQGYTAKRALMSLFECHNETSSIWSHLLPSLGFAGITMFNLFDFLDGESAVNDWVHEALILAYSFASTLLCVCSTIFHLFCCIDENTYRLTAKLDYTGIVIMIAVSFWPFMYHLFWCRPMFALFYSVAISLVGLFVLIVSWTPRFNRPELTHVRAFLFIGMGAFGIFPIPHAIYLNGWDKVAPIMIGLALMGALYVGGALLYGFQIPERFWPGKFNHGLLTSHFLFHVCSVAAATVHYWNAHRAVYWRAETLIC